MDQGAGVVLSQHANENSSGFRIMSDAAHELLSAFERHRQDPGVVRANIPSGFATSSDFC